MTARKLFRIEQAGVAPSADPAEAMAERHAELVGMLSAILKRLEDRGGPRAAEHLDTATREALALYQRELAQVAAIKGELDAISAAILATKREIASLHLAGQSGGSMHRVTDELSEVVAGTERATNVILEAAEAIDQAARTLEPKLDALDQGLAADIQDRIVSIYEACNFQDLTGQRIAKVVSVLGFIETKVTAMMQIWGGIESFRDVAPSPPLDRPAEARLLNGPALPDDEGRATQDMIDALFP